MLTLLASTVAVALIGGLLPALLGAVVGFLTLNYFFTPPVGTLTVSEPRNLLALGGVRGRGGRGRHGRGPGVPSRRRRPARPRRGGDDERAVAVGADRPGHRRGDRRAAPRDVRPGRRLAAEAGPGGLDRAGVVRHPVRGHTRRGRHPGPGRRQARAGALRRAAARQRPAGARGVRRADRAGARVPPAPRARRAGREPRARRGHLDGPAAGGLPRPSHAAGHHARRRRRAARLRGLRRRTGTSWSAPSTARPSSSSGSSTTCSTCPGCRAG